MPKGVVGTMDTVGFLTEPTVMADRCITYWFANRIDQCIILRNIYSYQYVVAKHQDDKGDEERFLQDVENNLKDYLLETFEGASVSARAIRKEEGDKMFTLAVSGVVFYDGKQYDVAQSVFVNGANYEIIDKGRGLR